MIPLRITTRAPVGFVAGHPVHLDALLMSVVARRARPAHHAPQASAELVPLDVPLARSECGRYYLASAMMYESDGSETIHVSRRFPVRTAFRLGPEIKRIDEKSGPHRAFRFPIERRHARGGLLAWYCLGEREAIVDLLSEVTHIGRKRHRGEGMLTLRGERWTVEPCEPWGEGFPVMREGEALRNLPLDTPGLERFRHLQAPLEPPYWLPCDEFAAVPL